jgi:ferredoxin
MGTRVGTDLTLDALRREFDAVMVAVGEMNDEKQRLIGLKASRDGIEADGHTFATGLPGVFAGGDAVRRRRMAVRACADGKVAATAIHQHLSGLPVTGVPRPFTTHYGRLTPEEMVHFMAGASAADRTAASGEDGGFTDEEARQESGRCLHCDCRKQTGCRLRQQCASYGVRTCERIGCLIPEAVVGDADPPKCSTKRMFSSDGGTRSPRPPIFSHVLRLGRFKGPRRTFERADVHPEIIYESGKCIDCGLCIQIAAGAEERLGLTFVGRGFNVRVGVPFGESVAAGLRRVGRECAAACPTGALALRDKGR